jgi:hypothetical protein
VFAADKMDFSKEDVDQHVSVFDVIEAKRVLCDPANRKAHYQAIDDQRLRLHYHLWNSHMYAEKKVAREKESLESFLIRISRLLVAKHLAQKAKAQKFASKLVKAALYKLIQCRQGSDEDANVVRGTAKELQEWWRAKASDPMKNIETIRSKLRRWIELGKTGEFDDVDLRKCVNERGHVIGGTPSRTLARLRCSQARQPGAKPLFQELEEKVAEWVDWCARSKVACTRALVMRQAHLLDPHMFGGPSSPDYFDRMKEWFYRFKKRCGFSFRKRTSVGQKLPIGWEPTWVGHVRNQFVCRRNANLILKFIEFCIAREHGVSLRDDMLPVACCFNTDQTPVYMECPRDVSLVRKGVKTVDIKSGGKEKDRLVVLLSCFALCDHLYMLSLHCATCAQKFHM